MGEVLLQFIFAFLGTASFSALFNVPKKYFISCGLTGAGGWMAYLLVLYIAKSTVAAAFIAAAIVTLTSRFLAINKKCPVTIFLIAGIFPLIPGSGVYYMAFEAINNNFENSIFQGLEALKIVGAMAFGIQLILSAPIKKIFFTKKL